MPVSQAVLVQCTLFAALAPVPLGLIAERMQMVSLRRREVLGGASGFSGLGVVLSGSIQAVEETSDGREVVLATAGVNHPFGVAELLADKRMSATLIAASNGTTVGTLDRETALEQLRKPELSWNVARMLAQRLCDHQAMQKILSVHSVPARLAAWLAWQCDGQAKRLTLPTHAELAWQLNTTRESVTRVLQRLVADGLVARDGDDWVMLNPHGLGQWGHAGS